MKQHIYWTYIISNSARNKLYIGVTNNLEYRIQHHKRNLATNKTWASRNKCSILIYCEKYYSINKAIKREKQLKGWSRKKKDTLIKRVNPSLKTFIYSHKTHYNPQP